MANGLVNLLANCLPLSHVLLRGCRAFFEATGKASAVSFPNGGRCTDWSIYSRSHGVRGRAFVGAEHLYAILCLYYYIKVAEVTN